MNVANQFTSAIGLKAPIVAARLKAEPGFGGRIGPLEILEPIPLDLATATTPHPIASPRQLDCAEV